MGSILGILGGGGSAALFSSLGETTTARFAWRGGLGCGDGFLGGWAGGGGGCWAGCCESFCGGWGGSGPGGGCDGGTGATCGVGWRDGGCCSWWGV